MCTAARPMVASSLLVGGGPTAISTARRATAASTTGITGLDMAANATEGSDPMADPHLTYPEAVVVGLLQGVTELFPVSSLGHSVLLPALIGGRWARDLSLTADKSPYLTFLVAVHVATAGALVGFFRRDWVRIVAGLFTSVRDRRIATPDQRLAWLLIIPTIPVGLARLALEHLFRTALGKPVPAAQVLTLHRLALVSVQPAPGPRRP